MKDTIKEIQEFLLSYCDHAHMKGYVLGISGGLDSSVLFKTLEPLKDLQVIAMMLPIHSLEQDEKDALELVKGSNRTILKVDLSPVYDAMVKALPPSDHEMSYHNLKPRLRMAALYQVAQANHCLVAGATNKSEFLTGYFTKHGDSGVDVMPFAEFDKEEMVEMAKVLQVSKTILEKAPSAGLYEGQTDEDEMQVSYADLNQVLRGEKVDERVYNRVKSMVDITEHKRHMPIVFRRKGS
ncbi:MAG: NAD(+) synthase [Tissierellia bacterium]|nr:NAD(+) synthase [Tissierellia bacterium]